MDLIRIPSIDVLTPRVIQNFIDQHNLTQVPRYKKLQKYYEGKHDILNRAFPDQSKPNNKLVNNFPSYIVNLMAGYFMGKPVAYSSVNEDYLARIQDIFNANNEQAINSLHAKQAGIKGISAELLWIDEASQVRISYLDVDNLILLFDYSIDPELLAVIRYYYIKDYVTCKDELNVELYTKEEIVYYKQGKKGLVESDRVPHYFGDIPINIYWNNDEALGDFERVITLIDAYDKSMSDSANDAEYFTDAYLLLKGIQVDPEELQDMKNQRVMVLDGETGDAKWLVKQTDVQTTEAYRNRLQQDIHKFSLVPDLSSQEFQGNLSGIALAYKFLGMEQLAATKERLFKESFYRRLKLITNILNTKGGNYVYTDIDMHFTRNLPVNIQEAVQTAKDLFGMVSQQTLLAQLPFIDNPQQELEKLRQEQENGDYSNLGNHGLSA